MLEREVVPSSSSKTVRSVPSNTTTTKPRPTSKGGTGTSTGYSPTVDTYPKPARPVPSTSISITSSLRSGPRLINSNYVAFVEKAVKDHKIFCLGGVYPAVRAALRKRGWVEKSVSTGNPLYMRSIIGPQLIKEVDTRSHFEDESEGSYTQRVLANYAPDFIWVIRRDNIPWTQLHREQTINRFPRAYFTTKVGIAACFQAMHWFSEPGVSDTFFPRCYRLSMEEEKQSFLEDYRLTACVGLLRWFCSNYEKLSDRGVIDSGSKVSCLCLDFALRQVNNYVRMRQHEDIDWLLPPAYLNQHWDIFLTQYYSVVHQRMKLNTMDATEPLKVKYEYAKKALHYLSQVWGTMSADGIMNVWICKPGARSRGKGIIILNQLDKIMGLLNQSQAREANWVVQKYIERPMLIYKTKFDLRQWFIVTDWAPLTVWFAKESYVRFCTKPFSLDDFHESIHLCNNAVQCKYTNAQNRDSSLPDENMWDCYTFQAYLKTIGKLEMWEKVIYPGMKQGILGVLLASQDSAEVKKNCFELYGADYMFTEDLVPWLIEINSCPCMAGSTSVTARMCAQCLEDTIKVVIDRKNDRNADTGMFELVYRQNPLTLNFTNLNANELLVNGKKVTREVDWPGLLAKQASKQHLTGPSRKQGKQPPPLPETGLTFTDLVQKLHLRETSKILGLTAYEAVQQALQTVAPVPDTGLGRTVLLPIPKAATLDPNGILTVRKLPSPQPPPGVVVTPVQDETEVGTIAKTPVQGNDLVKNSLNNNLLLQPSQLSKDLEKSTVPLSYLLYNAKTNPITITEMIREYAESTAKTKAMEVLARRVIEAERKPKKRTVKKSQWKSAVPSKTNYPSAGTSSSARSSGLTLGTRPVSPIRGPLPVSPIRKTPVNRNELNGKPLIPLPKTRSPSRFQHLSVQQSLNEAVDVSRMLKIRPLSPAKKLTE